jgi:hypothetical protein
MRFQFSTRSLLLTTAIVAIICAGFTAWARIFAGDLPFLSTELYLGITCPLWTPIAFLAYAIGRRTITARLVLAFTLAEAAAVGVCYATSQITW